MWQCIYDPESDEEHMRCRWIPENSGQAGHWAHYEPYGRESMEKNIFMDSVNEEHFLWSEALKEKGENLLKFSEEVEVSTVDDRLVTSKEETCKYDREKKSSYVFAHMLGEYVEKFDRVERPNFFKNAMTKKWTEDKGLMKRLAPRFKRENHKLRESPDYKLALGDISVKNYPRHYFFEVCDLYLDYMEEKEEPEFKLNPNAVVFVPMNYEVGPCTLRPLVRQAPKKICGAYLIEKPPKPQGFPAHKRPKSENSSVSNLCWQMKGETDNKIDGLEKKLDILIQLNHGPVIQAEKIV